MPYLEMPTRNWSSATPRHLRYAAGKPHRERGGARTGPECTGVLEDRKRSDKEAIGEDLQPSCQVGIWRSSARMKHCRLPIITLLLGPIVSACIVTTREGPGSPPKAAVEERAVTKPPDAIGNLPTEIGARHLLVQYTGAQSAPASITRSKGEAQRRAEEALARAQAGEDFVSLVAEYSDEPGAKERGGSLGRFQHHAMVRPFSEAAFRLKVGQLSNVVETPFGYHVILRTE